MEERKKIETTGKNIMACPIPYGGQNKMVFSIEDLVLIKVLRQEKGYDN